MLGASPGLQAIILHLRDRHDEADPVFDASIAALLERGDRGVAATLLAFQADGALATGDVARARRLAERAVEVADPLGDYHRVGMARSTLALVHGSCSRFDEGEELLDGLVALVEGAGREVFVPGLARVLGTLAMWRGEPEDARRWLEPEAGWTGSPRARTWRRRRCRSWPPRSGGSAATTTRRRSGPRTRARARTRPPAGRRAGARRAGAPQRPGRRARAAPPRARDPHGARASLGICAEPRGARGAGRRGRPGGARGPAAGGRRERAREIGCPRPPVEQPGHDALLARLRETRGSTRSGRRGRRSDRTRRSATRAAAAGPATGRCPAGRASPPPSARSSSSPSRASATRTSAPGCS